MGVEAARRALRSAPGAAPGALWFATATPAYLDKTNATTVHAALRQPADVAAFDFGGALRSGPGALRTALDAAGLGTDPGRGRRPARRAAHLRPTSRPAATAPAAVLVGDDGPGTPVIAEFLGRGVGHRRVPRPLAHAGRPPVQDLGGALRRDPLRALGTDAWQSGPEGRRRDGRRGRPGGRDRHARPGGQGPRPQARRPRRRPGRRPVGHRRPDRYRPCRTGAGLACSSRPRPGEVVAVVSLADGADVLVFRTTPAIAAWYAGRPGGRPDGRRRRPPLRQVPHLAGHGHPRAAPPARAPAGVVVGRLAQRGLEVRLRRVRGPHLGRRPPAAGPGLDAAAARSTTWCRSTGPTPRPPSPPTPSTGWPTRPARPSCSPSSTSTAAAGSPSS